ncbi:MAG: hypothetical protein Q9221_003321 [Calogaya cf. arnoldii]
MWLINARTLKLEEFWSEELTHYAILSHRWEDGEVSFKDIQQLEVAASKRGFIKIRRSCELALKNNLEYVWVDTCCINKESSAELSESINSMFRWYEGAAVCYAFLSDVDIEAAGAGSVEAEIQRSVWFDRGWTLQELLAPNELGFYDRSWKPIGTKRGLAHVLQQRTGIGVAALLGMPLSEYSIAHRMSWASQRTTTRIEDLAYCLLGIFDVNMPLLYGEGNKAFIRFQEEIIKRYDDHSIFAWPLQRDDVYIRVREYAGKSRIRRRSDFPTGLLATSPASFADCGKIQSLSLSQSHPTYSMTNRGLSCRLLAKPFMTDTYLVRLDCTDEGEPGSRPAQRDTQTYIGIFLRRLREDDQFARVIVEGQSVACIEAEYWDMRLPNWALSQTDLDMKKRSPKTILFNVRHDLPLEGWNIAHSLRHCNGFGIETHEASEGIRSGNGLFMVSDCNWNTNWDDIGNSFGTGTMSSPPGKYGYIGTLVTASQRQVITHLKLGFDFDYNPVCFVTESDRPDDGFRKFEASQIWQHGQLQPRTPFDGHIWSETDSEGYAWDVEGYLGLWAIKGDHQEGFRVKLAYRHRGVLKNPVEINIVRNNYKWVVHLWNT